MTRNLYEAARVGVDAEDLDAAREAATEHAAYDRVLEENAAWAPHAYDGTLSDAPQLVLEDVSEIPFIEGVTGVEQYQHRARVRARDGDWFAAVTPVAPGYERYCRERLGMGSPTVLQPDVRDARPMRVAEACRHGASFDALVAGAREAGRLVVHPYMGIAPVWALAGDVADAAGVPVQVLAPPPSATWIANDKAHLSEAVALAVGSDALLETRETRGLDALVDAVEAMRREHPSVGIKRTRCASAMGNLVLHREAHADKDADAMRARIAAFLHDTEWDGDETVLCVEWARTDLSPSTQCWIPPLGHGDPRVDGVYEQLLEGEARVFLGSQPSTLPASVNDELAALSLLTCATLQALGYVGRCSFDFVVRGDVDDEDGWEVFFTECNGRWGGTSTPMHLVDRVVQGPRPAYLAQDVIHPSLVGMSFDEVCARLGDSLFDANTQRGRYILYNVGPLALQGKLDVIALGDSPDDAFEAMRTRLPALLGWTP